MMQCHGGLKNVPQAPFLGTSGNQALNKSFLAKCQLLPYYCQVGYTIIINMICKLTHRVDTQSIQKVKRTYPLQHVLKKDKKNLAGYSAVRSTDEWISFLDVTIDTIKLL